MFNYYKWSEDTTLEKQIVDFIAEKNPDILAIQEFYDSDSINFTYPYKFIKTKSKTDKFGLAIYSKYKIILFFCLTMLLLASIITIFYNILI